MRALPILAAVSVAMAQTPAPGVNFFSIEKEIELGKSLAAAFQAKQQAQPDARLQAIGDRLAAQTDGTFQYRFFVYSHVSPEYEPGAFPGGSVFLPRSMVPADDANAAAILAHAIGHIALRQYTREMTRLDLTETGGKAAPPGFTTGFTPGFTTSPIQLARMQFNQRYEADADQFAVKLMIGAGYDPQALVRWLESFPVSQVKLALGDRPVPGARVAAVRQAIEAAR